MAMQHLVLSDGYLVNQPQIPHRSSLYSYFNIIAIKARGWTGLSSILLSTSELSCLTTLLFAMWFILNLEQTYHFTIIHLYIFFVLTQMKIVGSDTPLFLWIFGNRVIFYF